MEQKFEFTRNELIEAFKKWQGRYEEDPDNHFEDKTGELSADYLIELLNE